MPIADHTACSTAAKSEQASLQFRAPEPERAA